jgi:hypothetical protein
MYKAPGVPFDDVTTFKRDYRGPVSELTKSFKPENVAFSSGVPLEDLTTNRKDYIKYPASNFVNNLLYRQKAYYWLFLQNLV